MQSEDTEMQVATYVSSDANLPVRLSDRRLIRAKVNIFFLDEILRK